MAEQEKMKVGFDRFRRPAMIVLANLFILGLSVNCGVQDSVSHTAYLETPAAGGGDVDVQNVEFFLDEEVVDGTITGWVQGSGCDIWIDICDDQRCETIFHDIVFRNEEVSFRTYYDDSVVFTDFLDGFVPCYKDGGEYAQEPMSCQKWSCDDAKDEIKVVLESPCWSSALIDIEAEYFDERTPLKGPMWACAEL